MPVEFFFILRLNFLCFNSEIVTFAGKHLRKMGRTSGPKTKEKILIEAFKLFTTRQYGSVTLADFEQITGIKRGSVFYHFGNKQELFEAVVETSLLNRTAILNIPVRGNDVLKSFILAFIDNCEKAAKDMADYGIQNINLAYYIIECTALCFFDHFNERSRQMREVELGVWTQVVRKAMKKGEIADSLEPEAIALLFLNLYSGHAYAATKEDKGCDIQQLHKELFDLYDLVKSK